jgi:two-component system response regulator HydG
MGSGALIAETRSTQSTVLIVDDEPMVHRLLGEQLAQAQYLVCSATTAEECLRSAGRDSFDVILLDVNLPDIAGLELLRRLKAESVLGAVVMISAQEDAPVVVEAMRLGALDYLVKPLDPTKVLATVALAARAGRLERENRRLRHELEDSKGDLELIGCSPAVRRLAGVVRRVAESDATVLIEGRPGSGKTLVARLIRQNGRRSQGPLVTCDSEATTPESIEQSLRDADGGTLLLEDIDRMPALAQSRLVRYLKEERGGNRGPDARVVATTSTRLPELVARGKFREDLYYRLNVFPVQVPSLQERRDDLALLATHFLAQASKASGTQHQGFTATAMILLETHPWPGNIAQLQSAITRAHTLAGSQAVDRAHLLGPAIGVEVQPAELPKPGSAEAEPEAVREEEILPFEIEEKRLLARALKATSGNVRRAAELLQIGRATLYRKIQVYNLKLH